MLKGAVGIGRVHLEARIIRNELAIPKLSRTSPPLQSLPELLKIADEGEIRRIAGAGRRP